MYKIILLLFLHFFSRWYSLDEEIKSLFRIKFISILDITA